MKNIKKIKVKTALIIALTIFGTGAQTLVATTPANAAMAIAGGGGPLALAIAGLVGVFSPREYSRASFTQLIGVVVLLDSSQSSIAKFKPLTSEDANAIGLTSAELDSYHSEMEEINQVFSTIQYDLSGMNNPTPAEAKTLWEKYSGVLSADSFGAIKKITSQTQK